MALLRRPKRDAWILALTIICGVSGPTDAADIAFIQAQGLSGPIGNEQNEDGGIICHVRLKGAIEPGDAEKLNAIAQRHSLTHHILCLDSLGGSYEEGIRLAEMVFGQPMGTAVEKGASCFSACALIFMAGASSEDGIYAWRRLHVLAKLGFHAPYLLNDEKRYDEATLDRAFAAGIAAVRKLMKLGASQYAVSGHIPQSLVLEMLERGPKELFIVDKVHDAARFQIDLVGGRALTLISDEHICNACLNWLYRDVADPGPCRTKFSGHKVRKLGTNTWLPGFGGEGAGFCVASQRSGAWNLYSSVAYGQESPKEHEFVSAESWWFYPPDTPIQQLAK